MPKSSLTLRERFESKIERIPFHSCWEWNGHFNRLGYGMLNCGEKMRSAHRVSYEYHVGQIPDGLHIDHLCRNRACVNPAHLEAVTPRENIMRSNAPAALNARRLTCRRGHPFDSINR